MRIHVLWVKEPHQKWLITRGDDTDQRDPQQESRRRPSAWTGGYAEDSWNISQYRRLIVLPLWWPFWGRKLVLFHIGTNQSFEAQLEACDMNLVCLEQFFFQALSRFDQLTYSSRGLSRFQSNFHSCHRLFGFKWWTIRWYTRLKIGIPLLQWWILHFQILPECNNVIRRVMTGAARSAGLREAQRTGRAAHLKGGGTQQCSLHRTVLP